MNRFSLSALTVAFAFCSAFGEGVLYRFDFEGAELASDKQIGSAWKIVAGAGRDRSRALVWESEGCDTTAYFRLELPKFQPGMIVEAECWAKAERFEGDGSPTFDINWNKLSGGWYSGACPSRTLIPPNTKRGRAAYRPPEKDTEGWSRLTFRTPLLKSDAAIPFMQFIVPRESSGRVLFDDVVIRIVEKRHVICFGTSAYQNRAAEGDVTFAAGICRSPSEKVRAKIEYRGANGAKKTVWSQEVAVTKAVFRIPAQDFALGTQKVWFSLIAEDGKVMGRSHLVFTRTAEPDQRKVYIDEYGRCIANGKPFFPLGMYWHDHDLKNKPELLEHYASGPFNCLQSYDPEITVAELDAYWKKGLYVIPSLSYYFAKEEADADMIYMNTYKDITTRADEIRELGQYVSEIKDHPAVLAWYVCSEMPLRWLSRFREHTELLRVLDPEHPQFAVFCHDDSPGPMMNCYDVMALDIYSLRTRISKKSQLLPDQADVWTSTKAALYGNESALGLRTMWQVPQAFAWKWDYPEYPDCIFPTAKEYRSMCWQHIAMGANGLLMYAYGQMVQHEWGKPDFEKQWQIVTAAAAEVKSQIPVLLKDPGPKPASVPEKTLVRTWQDEASVYVLVTATHPEAVKGDIELPGVGAKAETLLGEGVAARDGGLTVDLPPFGVALVRLTRMSK